MFVSTNRLRTESGRGIELEERFRNSSVVAEQADGFLGFEMWKTDTDEDYDEYLIVTHWESKEAHRQWTHSDAFKTSTSKSGTTRTRHRRPVVLRPISKGRDIE